MTLKGRTALVTGSTSGIGLAIAHALAAEGANIVINGLGTEAEIAKVVADVGSHGTRVAFGSADMLRNNQIADMIAPIETFPIEKWDAVLAINLTSSFHTIRTAVPGMKARKWGRIINICSAHSLVASLFKSAYVAAKHGLAGLTKCVALELAETGVTVNAISPGFVWTPLVEKQIPDIAKTEGITEEQAKKKLLAKQPTGRFVTSEEIGAAAVYLASDAAGSITGTNLSIDGSWTAE